MSTTVLQIAVLVLVVAAGLIFILVGGKRADRRRRERFADRAEMSFDEFYRRYYQDSGLEIGSVRKAVYQVADALHVPTTRLRPDDRFDVELAPEKGWELDDGAGLLGQALRRTDTAETKSAIKTLDDYVRATCSRQ